MAGASWCGLCGSLSAGKGLPCLPSEPRSPPLIRAPPELGHARFLHPVSHRHVRLLWSQNRRLSPWQLTSCRAQECDPHIKGLLPVKDEDAGRRIKPLFQKGCQRWCRVGTMRLRNTKSLLQMAAPGDTRPHGLPSVSTSRPFLVYSWLGGMWVSNRHKEPGGWGGFTCTCQSPSVSLWVCCVTSLDPCFCTCQIGMLTAPPPLIVAKAKASCGRSARRSASSPVAVQLCSAPWPHP